MPFVGATTIEGDSKELLAKYDKVAAKLQREQRPPAGLISHYCMETDNGIRVVNCYETENQLRAHYDNPEFQEALKQAGMKHQPPQILRVHKYFHIKP